LDVSITISPEKVMYINKPTNGGWVREESLPVVQEVEVLMRIAEPRNV
jgi:hypothetical protein